MPHSRSLLNFIGMKRLNENRPTSNTWTGHAQMQIEIGPEFYRVAPPFNVTLEMNAFLRRHENIEHNL